MNSTKSQFHIARAAAVAMFFLLGSLAMVNDPWRTDEAFTYAVTEPGNSQAWATLKNDVHPPLFYVLLMAWRQVFPSPEAMQIFTLLSGALAILVASDAAARGCGRRAGAYTALLWASFPLLIHFSQDARMYAPALLFETLALWGWVRARIESRKSGWIVVWAGLTAAIYTHYHCAFFAAGLLSGDALFSFARAVKSGESVRRGLWSGLRSPVALGLATAAAFAPWLPILNHQWSHHPFLDPFFHAPTLQRIMRGLVFYPYALHAAHPGQGWFWLPGAALLIGLPLLASVSGMRFAWGKSVLHGGFPVLAAWIALAPLTAMLLFSRRGKPIFAVERHALIFLPFLLVASGCLLGRWSERRGGKIFALAVFALTEAVAVRVHRLPHDADFSRVRDTILEKTPPGDPILTFPELNLAEKRLVWERFPLLDSLPYGLERGALAATLGTGRERQEQQNRLQAFLARCREARLIYGAYHLQIWHVEGVPLQALLDLYGFVPDSTTAMARRQIGDAERFQLWGTQETAQAAQPELETYRLASDKEGVRLGGEGAALRLPAAGEFPESFGAFAIGGQARHAEDFAEMKWEIGLRGEKSVRLPRGEFLMAEIVPRPNDEIRARIRPPSDLADPGFVARGDVPPGVYVCWAGYVPLPPGRFAAEGMDGWTFDVGVPGDELFLRDGFHEREGAGDRAVRWTRGEFRAQLPVLGDRPIRRLLLHGLVPEQIERPELRIEIEGDAPDVRMETETLLEQGVFKIHEIELPRPLAPGIYELRFEMETFVPSETGAGGDPRELGFFLAKIGLAP